MIPPPVEAFVRGLGDGLPAFVTDLAGLRAHVSAVRAALPPAVDLHYAAKANPEAPVLRALEPFVDGFEVASGAELAHVRAACPSAPVAFGGPAKTVAELRAALDARVLVHVESVAELRSLARLADERGQDVDVLLRVNPPIPVAGAALVMGGQPSPFGLDPGQADLALAELTSSPRVRFRGLHVHLASGLDAPARIGLAVGVLGWADAFLARHRLEAELVNLGGGMAVSYDDPRTRFDWKRFGDGLAELAPPYRLRVEPGRSLTAYAGWYAVRVLDVRPSHGEWFATVEGGTHHLRTPAARGHSQPFTVIACGPGEPRARLTVAGALCTPKDVLARQVCVESIAPGDVLAFGMAGAYGWNISHHDFLMHPAPAFHYLG